MKECDKRGLTKEPRTSYCCTGQVMWKITIKNINNSEILLRSPLKVNLFSFAGHSGLKLYLNLNFCSFAGIKIAWTSSHSSSQLLQFASLNLLQQSRTTANFLLSSLIPRLNCTPDPPCLVLFGPCKLTKVPFYKAFISLWLLSVPAGLGRLWSSLTGLSHTNDCMSLRAVCSDSQTSSWRINKYLFDVCSIVLCPSLFCFCSIPPKSVGCKCQVKCRSHKIPWQHVMRSSDTKWWFCALPSTGDHSLRGMIHCHADVISAWCPAIHCALPGRTWTLLYPEHRLHERNMCIPISLMHITE